MALIKCTDCDKEYSSNASACPNCANPTPVTAAPVSLLEKDIGGALKTIFEGILGIIIIVVFIGFLIYLFKDSNTGSVTTSGTTEKNQSKLHALLNESSAVAPETAIPGHQIPEAQQRFLATVTSYTAVFKNASNELQESAARSQRGQAVAGLGLGTKVNNWVGKIKNMGTTGDGKALLSVSIGRGVVVHTWNNAFSDMTDKTLINPNSSMYNTLANLAKGQDIIFSGTFIRSEMDYYKENSMTIHGSMTEPEYLFKFSSIKSAQ